MRDHQIAVFAEQRNNHSKHRGSSLPPERFRCRQNSHFVLVLLFVFGATQSRQQDMNFVPLQFALDGNIAASLLMMA